LRSTQVKPIKVELVYKVGYFKFTSKDTRYSIWKRDFARKYKNKHKLLITEEDYAELIFALCGPANRAIIVINDPDFANGSDLSVMIVLEEAMIDYSMYAAINKYVPEYQLLSLGYMDFDLGTYTAIN
jgi:hypothetical protein